MELSQAKITALVALGIGSMLAGKCLLTKQKLST